jgi:acyl-CoA dehydrogenase
VCHSAKNTTSFREQVRRFVQHEVAPHHARWDRDGIVDRICGARLARKGSCAPI